MKKLLLFFACFNFYLLGFSQVETVDSIQTIDTVLVRAFEQLRKAPAAPVSVSVLTSSVTRMSAQSSLLLGMNTIAGVRMEERSPGSYRLSIRGSSLRSPFGVRNIKVYWNDIPVTDPSGNTYFNQFASNNFSYLEVFKGPASSMYGAGTGGLVLMYNFTTSWKPGFSLEYVTGSFKMHNIFASARFGKTTNKNLLTYAHNQSDGYRTQSSLRRDNFSWTTNITREKQEITAGVLFTDMYYQTPGALTLNEYINDPKAARPAGGGFPSAVNAKAAIYQKNLLVGLSHLYKIASRLRNTSTIYGAYSQIKNPAIRNYEKRTEPSFGGRTVFGYTTRANELNLDLFAGSEFQQGYFNTRVSKNRNGEPDTLQTDDDIDNRSLNLFFQAMADIDHSWYFLAGVSLNQTEISVTRTNVYPVVKKNRKYKNEIAPRFSIMKQWDKVHLSGSLSKGFSPPTVPEVLPSTGVISTELEAEKGWNYETNLRAFLFHRKLTLGLTAFYFKLDDALVQRRDVSGADFFVNAGNIKQKGIEFSSQFFHSSYQFITEILARSDLSFNHFRYGSFIKGTDDFSGKHVPSVPSSTINFLLSASTRPGIYLNANYYSASAIYVNDANTAKADPYHLLGMQLGWKNNSKHQHRFSIYLGADNLLNEKYSLGNDINAAANRFYNAAPTRNFYVGALFQWNKKAKS